MIYLDEDSLICDFAETYHILDYKALPPTMAGVLACGLRPDSRIKMLMSGQSVNTDTMLRAGILDRLSVLTWQNTEDGQKGNNYPEMVLPSLMGEKKESNNLSFDSGADFDAYRERLINGS